MNNLMFNEEFHQVEQFGKTCLKKWEPAINDKGGIKDEHMAITTAILLENYLQHLNSDPSLIMEDQIQANNFQGVNLALLGLIRRTIPELIGAELVGIQAMPTPESPLFFLIWEKFLANTDYKDYPGNQQTWLKNQSTGGPSGSADELWGTPLPAGSLGVDAFYTSSQLRNVSLKKLSNDIDGSLASPTTRLASPLPVSGTVPAATYAIKLNWTPVTNGSFKAVAVSGGTVVGEAYVAGAYYTGSPVAAAVADKSGVFASSTVSFDGSTQIASIAFTGTDVDDILLSWEYNQEANPRQPELSLKIKKTTVNLVRRQLRGRFTLDSITDARVLHGISIENELFEMMKIELTNEINREIVRDLRLMAAFRRELDYTKVQANTDFRNYEDIHRLILDTISVIRSEIWNVGRMGQANWILGNPVTLAWLDRVPGFVGSGVSYDSNRGLTYAGSIGTMKFYRDPQYPIGELLIGYKGPGSLETGYIHAPYLPITATPTMYNPLTGDPVKIFYTRYGKTFKDIDANLGGKPSNAIYRGEFQYATLTLKNMPMYGASSINGSLAGLGNAAPNSTMSSNNWPGSVTLYNQYT